METFKKRQKAWARKEKQQKKAARRMERRIDKAAQSKVQENQSAVSGPTDLPNVLQDK